MYPARMKNAINAMVLVIDSNISGVMVFGF